jgi:hypothetical protein
MDPHGPQNSSINVVILTMPFNEHSAFFSVSKPVVLLFRQGKKKRTGLGIMKTRATAKTPLTLHQLTILRYLTASQLQEVYGVPTNFLRDLRHGKREGEGPPFKRLGYRTILYGPREQIELWLANQPGGGQRIPVQQDKTKPRRGAAA